MMGITYSPSTAGSNAPWEDDLVKRGLKLGIGIPLLLIGLFMTLGGIALLVLVGTDGTFSLPATRATSTGHALVLETLDVGENFPASGSFAATVGVTVVGDGGDVFVGIGPAADVARYLRGVQVDRIVQVNWPGGMRTEPGGRGSRTPDPPDEQSFWVAKSQGASAGLDWSLTGGDWTMVIMNTDGSADVSVTASGTLSLPALGPIGIALLVAGLGVLAGGVLLTISGSKTPRPGRTPPPRPDDALPA
jgi:hypothetical protein